MGTNKENERKEFSDETIEKAWKRSGGYCEECGKKIKKEHRGRDGEDYWEAHHKDGNPKNDKPENCQILCWPCHEKTFDKSFSERVDEILRKDKPVRLVMRKNINIKQGEKL